MLREDFSEVLQRNIAFASDAVKQGVLLQVTRIADMELPPVKPLEDWQFPRDTEAYMEAYLGRFVAQWRQRAELQDDLVPWIKPYYGIAEHTAFLGGAVTYGGDTSYHQHPIKEWEDFPSVRIDEENENFRMLLASMRYLRDRADDTGYVAALRGADGPMDFANALRGNDLFYDLYDETENVHRLMELCTEAAAFTLRRQREIVGQVAGGVMTGFGLWLPGNAVGHISEDASSMCAREMYREFGLPYTKQLLEEYDCALFHVHTLGRHALPDIASLEKIRYIDLTYDPNQPSPIDVWRENRDILSGKTGFMTMTRQEIEANLEYMAGQKLVIRYEATTMQDAEEVVRIIRSI